MDNKIIGIIVSIVVSLVMVGGVLSPIISSVGGDLGEPVTFNQQGSINASFEMGKVDREIVIDFVEGGLKVGDVTYTNLSSVTFWTPFVYSDYVQCTIKSDNSGVQFNVFETLTLENINPVVGDRITVTPTSVTLSGSADKTVETGNVYSIGSTSADKVTVVDMGDRNNEVLPLINSINDIVCVGFYNSGELDTTYSVINGVVKVGEDYTASLNYNFQLKDGTTDIYEIETFKVVVSDGTTTEEFVPYYALIPSEIEGHADHGVAYNLVGIVPMLVILAVLLMAAGLIFRSRY